MRGGGGEHMLYIKEIHDLLPLHKRKIHQPVNRYIRSSSSKAVNPNQGQLYSIGVCSCQGLCGKIVD